MRLNLCNFLDLILQGHTHLGRTERTDKLGKLGQLDLM